MMQVRKIANTENMDVPHAPSKCATCGKLSFDDPGMKKISFGAKEGSGTDVCLCSSCANQLKGMLSIII